MLYELKDSYFFLRTFFFPENKPGPNQSSSEIWENSVRILQSVTWTPN